MTTRLLIGSSLLAMTAAERAAGRYMRAPDHPGGGGDGDAAVAEPEARDDQVNDPVVVDEDIDTGDDPPPADDEDDSPPADGTGGEEGGEPPESPPANADPNADRLAALEQRLNDTERDVQYWRGRFDGTINEDGTPVSQTPDTIAPDDPDRPDPANYQYGETDAQYITDLAEYAADKRFEARRERERVETQLEEIDVAHNARIEEAKTRYPDYDEKVIQGANVDPATGEPKWFCSRLMSLGMRTSEYGPDVAYELANMPAEESKKIAMMSPLDQAVKFGELQYKAKLARGESAEGEAQPQRVSNAPPPPPRAKGGGSGGKVFDPEDYEQLEAHDEERRKSRGRRNR